MYIITMKPIYQRILWQRIEQKVDIISMIYLKTLHYLRACFSLEKIWKILLNIKNLLIQIIDLLWKCINYIKIRYPIVLYRIKHSFVVIFPSWSSSICFKSSFSAFLSSKYFDNSIGSMKPFEFLSNKLHLSFSLWHLFSANRYCAI